MTEDKILTTIYTQSDEEDEYEDFDEDYDEDDYDDNLDYDYDEDDYMIDDSEYESDE